MKNLYECDENKILGTVGALLGGLLGLAIWISCGYYWLIPGIVGFVFAKLIIKGYMLLAGSISRTGLIICIVISLLLISVSEIGSVMAHVFFEWQIHDPAEVIKNVGKYVKARGILKRMIGNTIFGIMTFSIGCFFLYYKIWKETADGPKEEVTINTDDPEGFR